MIENDKKKMSWGRASYQWKGRLRIEDDDEGNEEEEGKEEGGKRKRKRERREKPKERRRFSRKAVKEGTEKRK